MADCGVYATSQLSFAVNPVAKEDRMSRMNQRSRARLVGCAALVATLAACAPAGSSRLATPSPRDLAVPPGAATSFSPTEADARVSRVEDMLQNRVPGLEVLPLRDGTYTLRLRGGHTLGGNPADDEPLLVIDDVPVQEGWLGTALAGVAPRDVARIDVLKDAAAASRYGYRGSHGVIVITTKRGR